MSMLSSAPLFGAVIEKGPLDWQIIQQTNGKADIYLAGKWYFDKITGLEKVYVRIMEECTSSTVIPYTTCTMLGDNQWEVTIKDVPAGGLYRIEVSLNNNDEGLEWSNRGDMIHHIGVGDIFVIAGQSNAAGYGRDPIYDMPELGIHVLRNYGNWDIASHPLSDSTRTQHPVNRERINPGHSPFLNFARQLKRILGYPIGLIPTAKGGSSLSSWNPGESGELYQNMIEIIRNTGGKIKGVLWYQGCGDSGEENSQSYLTRFGNLVKRMREDLGQNELPFFTVQLNRYVDSTIFKADKGWGTVKEAQRQAARQIPKVYITPSLDAATCDIIHNCASSNMVIGERLARLALKYLYNYNSLCSAPEISSAERLSGNRVSLVFENVFERLTFRKAEPGELPFTIEDEEGTVQITHYNIVKNTFILDLEREIKGKTFVSCGAEQCPKFQMPFDTVSFLPLLAFYRVEIR